jgi:lipopolysaccharide transport system ATP-binding protein
MSKHPRIAVENLNKEFRIYERPQDRLIELISRKSKHKLFKVLSDISFAVAEGKSFGIIGNNGAGKSTLLKLLVGTLQPTSGNIAVHGQVAALLELGAGFHPEFTGRRNIFLNAALLGVSDENIVEMEKGIIEFSGLGDFIDRPVKTYSSGMYVRLAFSIATMVRPDILVIDEALSVGDMAFQKKCVQRMNKFREDEKTMVFCSHSMFHIQELCDTAIWLHEGRIKEIGDSDKVVADYEDFCNSSKTYNNIREDVPDGIENREQSAQETEVQDCRINTVSVQTLDGEEVSEVIPLSTLVLKMEVEVLVDNMEGHFGFAFMRSAEEPLASFLTTNFEGINHGPFQKGEILSITLVVESVAMRIGEFYVLGGMADKSGLLWYESKFSKLLTVAANKGVGAIIMKSAWTVEQN